MPQVYLLRCADNTYYTGWTTDVNKRLVSHNQGIASRYTRSRLPVTLVYVEEALNKSDALKREYQIRLLNRKKKEALAAAYALRLQKKSVADEDSVCTPKMGTAQQKEIKVETGL